MYDIKSKLKINDKHIGRNLRFDCEGHWAGFGDIGQTLGRHWADIGVLHISYKTFCTSHPR